VWVASSNRVQTARVASPLMVRAVTAEFCHRCAGLGSPGLEDYVAGSARAVDRSILRSSSRPPCVVPVTTLDAERLGQLGLRTLPTPNCESSGA